MANQEHLAILNQGVEPWNQWRQEHPDIQPDLNEANLSEMSLEGIDFSEAHLKRANLKGTHLEKASLSRAHLEEANLSRTNLTEVDLSIAHLEEADLSKAYLLRANLNGTYLEKALLDGIYLEDTTLERTHLEGSSLRHAHLEGTLLNRAHLEGADLREAFFNNMTKLYDVTLSNEKYGSALLADVYWNDTNLAVVDWTHMKILGDVQTAYRKKTRNGTRKTMATQINDYQTAVRANRQLVVVLRNQGLNEEADYFAYQAQQLQRVVWRLRKKPLKYVFSWFLDLLAGYGYRPLRSFIAYLLVVIGFAVIYYFLGQSENTSLSFWGSLVYSIASFHGRGYFPGISANNLNEPIIDLAALEAILGLLIEISFIATFTQRFFGK